MKNLLSEFIIYLKYLKNYSDCTVKSYKKDIEQYNQYLDENNLMLDTISRDQIRFFLKKLLDEGISKKSIKRKVAAIRHYYNFLNEEKYLNKNPFINLKTAKAEITYPKVLFLEEINALFEANKKRTGS